MTKKQPGTAETETVDMTRGVYRRVYSCWLHGRRINSVSDAAQVLFQRLILIADDFGNLRADPETIRGECFPRIKAWTARKIEKALAELLATGAPAKSDEAAQPALVVKYAASGDTYLHLSGFTDLQPANKHGRRIQRYPKPPNNTLAGEVREDAGSSGVSASEYYSESDSDSEIDSEVNPGPTRRKPPVEPAPRIAWDSSDGWSGITERDRAEWALAYPACDLDRQLAAMTAWIKSAGAKGRKSDWRRFIVGWLTRSQDRGGDARASPILNGQHAEPTVAELRRQSARQRTP